MPWMQRKAKPSEAPVLTRKIADSFHTAPGWREITQEFYLDEDAAYPRDPAVTRAFKAMDPGIIPLWIRSVYMSPAETGNPEIHVFGRHGFGRFDPNSQDQFVHHKIHRGTYIGPLPNRLDMVWEGEKDPRASDLPGAYLPWDWNFFKLMQARLGYNTNTSLQQKKQDLVWTPAARSEASKAAMREDFQYRLKDLTKFVQGKLDLLSEGEVIQYLKGAEERKKNPPKKLMLSVPGL